VFEDFRVRHDEWQWLSRQLSDLQAVRSCWTSGCGNGALLLALASLIRRVGSGCVHPDDRDRDRRAQGEPNLCFVPIEGPQSAVP